MTAMYGRLASAAARAGRLFSVCRVVLLAAFLSFAAFPPSSAHAISSEEAVDFAVDALVEGGKFIGIYIPPEAAHLIKDLVGCMVDGKSVGECAKEAAVKTALKNAPEEVQKIASCLAGGGDLAQCAAAGSGVLDKIPEDARPLVECLIGGGDLAACAEKTAGTALSKEMQDAVNQLKQLQAEVENEIGGQPGVVRRILLLAEGLQEGDLGKIIAGGGPEVAKIVISIVLSVLVPPVAPIVGPVVSALIDEYYDIVADLVKMLQTGDFSELPGRIVEFYFTMMIAAPCALVPDGAFKEAICGNLAKLIGAIGGLVNDIVDFLGDVAEAIGDFFSGVFDEIFGDGKEDPEVCGTPNAYFANHYASCMGAAAGASGRNNLVGSLNAECVAHFNRCYDNARAAGICNQLNIAFGGHVSKIEAAFNEGAQAYALSARAYVQSKGTELCSNRKDRHVQKAWEALADDFVAQCAKALGQNIPLRADTCKFNPTTYPLAQRACGSALSYFGGGWQAEHERRCEEYCYAAKGNCPPDPLEPICAEVYDVSSAMGTLGTRTVKHYGFDYELTPPRGGYCWLRHDPFTWPWDERINPWDRIANPLDRIANPWNQRVVDFVRDRFGLEPITKLQWWVSDRFVNSAIKNSAWLVTNGMTPLNGTLPAGLAVGNCTVTRTLSNPVVQWVGLAPSPRPVYSKVLSLDGVQRLQVSMTSVSLVTGGFASCSGVDSGLATRSSSGFDRSSTPRRTVAPAVKPDASGGAKAIQSSSGASTARSNSAMDRLSGDGMGTPAPSTKLFEGGGTAAGSSGVSKSKPGGGWTAGRPASSSGFDTVKPGGTSKPPSSSSGFDTVKPGGTSVPKPPTSSSGFDTVKPGGTSVPRSAPSSSGGGTIDYGGCPGCRSTPSPLR